MDAETSLGRLLQAYMNERGMSLGRLARASGVSRATIHHWLSGVVAHPYYWEHLLQVAGVLCLNRARVDRLLRAAGHPSLDTLAATARDDARRALLARWSVATRSSLPLPLTSFVGRQAEVDALADLLVPPVPSTGSGQVVRLLTLTGPGGSGKTRLALRVAGELLDVFPDGVHFVDCAPLVDAALVLPAVARVLELREVAGQSPLERLVDVLRGRRVLLLLDNLEHLPAAGRDIVALLSAAAPVTALVTSRVALHVSGEHEWPVAPFGVPDPGAGLAALAGQPAVELFVARARAANPAFALTPANAAGVAQLCARLDGLPLALELAAARTRRFDPAGLLARFPGRLDLGSDGPVDVPARQQTLRDAIGWSVQLLAPDERQLFSRLAVFAGGWTPAAAVVCRGPGQVPRDVDAGLRTLVDASLVERATGPDGVGRYRMLETIREYALEQLVASEDDELVRCRHADAFLALAESGEAYIPQTRRGDWFERVDAERENLRAALDWALARDRPLAARLAAALWPYWHEYSVLSEGRGRLVALLDGAGEDMPPAVRAQLLTGAGVLAISQSDYAAALPAVEQALALWSELGERRGQAIVLRQRGWMAWQQGEIERALADFTQAEACWRALDEPRGSATMQSDRALILILSGRFAEAAPLLAEAHALYEQEGDLLGIARTIGDSGLAAMLQEDLANAIPLLQRSLALCRESGTNYVETGVQFYLGTALCFAGLLDDAAAQLAAALEEEVRKGNQLGISMTLLACAALAHRQGRAERAACLCGAVVTAHERAGIVMVPVARAIYARELGAVRAQLDEDTFHYAFARGREMSLADAVAFATE
jgi:predicted ATPase/transcriptional regulator with XRE-family HTH domain